MAYVLPRQNQANKRLSGRYLFVLANQLINSASAIFIVLQSKLEEMLVSCAGAQAAPKGQRSCFIELLNHAVIAVVSAYQPAAVSPKGAVGLMQVMPETANSHGVRDPVDVTANLRVGTRHLSGLMARFDNRLDLVLAAYNAGEGAVRRHGNSVPPFADTRNYEPAVIGKYQAISQRARTKSAKPIPAHNHLSSTRLDSTALTRLR